MIKQHIEQTYDNAVVLVKAAELTAHIVKQVAGNAVSNSINNSEISAQSVESLCLAKIQKEFNIATA